MESFIVSAAWFGFLLYCLFSIGKNYFGREILTNAGKAKISELPFVSIIIPARNEEANIERCVTSLLKQSYPPEKYKVIVVDDNSSDNTSHIVEGIMTDYSGITLVGANELPDGWTGKNHACWTGVWYATGEWYCFVDADVVSEPRLLEAAMEFACSEQIGLLSINPFQELISASERCLLPAIFFAIASSINFKNVNDPSRPEAVANGQFMLFRSNVYEAIGGHQTVQDEIMEDMAFAKIVKRSGNRLRWVFGEDLVKTRMYRSFSHIWEGFSKNLGDVMNIRSVSVSIYFCLKSLLLGWMPVILPLWTLLNLAQGEKNIFSYWGCGLSLFGSAIMLMLSLSIVKALRIPLWHFLFFPLGFTMHAALIVNSLWRRKRGGRKWKDRVYLRA